MLFGGCCSRRRLSRRVLSIFNDLKNRIFFVRPGTFRPVYDIYDINVFICGVRDGIFFWLNCSLKIYRLPGTVDLMRKYTTGH